MALCLIMLLHVMSVASLRFTSLLALPTTPARLPRAATQFRVESSVFAGNTILNGSTAANLYCSDASLTLDDTSTFDDVTQATATAESALWIYCAQSCSSATACQRGQPTHYVC